MAIARPSCTERFQFAWAAGCCCPAIDIELEAGDVKLKADLAIIFADSCDFWLYT